MERHKKTSMLLDHCSIASLREFSLTRAIFPVKAHRRLTVVDAASAGGETSKGAGGRSDSSGVVGVAGRITTSSIMVLAEQKSGLTPV